MTLFLPALVAAASARASGAPVVASSSTGRRAVRPDEDERRAAASENASASEDEKTSAEPRARTPLAEALRAASENAMTMILAFRGDSMAPALRAEGRASGRGDDRASGGGYTYLLARRLAHPFRSASVGDVVAFAHPLERERTLVRRVSALEGEELVDVTNASVYVVPKDHAWVTADADAADDGATRGGRHEDSRSFGPVDASALEWRVIYSFRSAADHGVVENSAHARVADAPVLEAEFESAMEKLGFGDEKSGGE